MKAKQDFVIHVDKDGNLVSDGTEIKVEKGEDVDKKLTPGQVLTLLVHLPDFLDVQKSAGIIKLNPEEEKKYDFHPKPEVVPEHDKVMKITKRKYSYESLLELYEKEGIKSLKEIGAKFTPPVTDRSGKKLINEILAAQEHERF